MRRIVVVFPVIIWFVISAHAQNRPEFKIARAPQPPKIDGILNDDVWQQPPLRLGDWIAYNPLRGGKSDQRTEVRVAYDERYIYFGIHCFDTEPDKIRTTISRRDTAFNDDWFALSLDSAGTGQTAYHLFVNPSGIQMDALNTSASGEQFEADFLWDSAERSSRTAITSRSGSPCSRSGLRGTIKYGWAFCFFGRSADPAFPIRGRRCRRASG